MPSLSPDTTLLHLFHAALQAVSPALCLPPHLPAPASLAAQGRLVVIGAGKAAAAMAAATYAHFGDRISHGCVVTRYGHGASAGSIDVIEAAHPVPDAAGEQAATRILQAVQGLTADDTVIALMSGGASSLLALPAPGLTLTDKQAINRDLLRSGANIHEMNTVRKHLSAIKGGRLAQACGAAKVLTYVISDVPSDDPATVGSGPTLENHSTPDDALAILARYGITVPQRVLQHLRSAECRTPVFDHSNGQRPPAVTIATARYALEAAAQAARALGLNAWILSDAIEGEARDIGAMHAALAMEIARGQGPVKPPCVLLSGGETTVTVRGTGRGGRNAECLLSMLHMLGHQPGIAALACDTDGIDGVEENAGAWFAPGDLAQAHALQMQIRPYLDNNDAWHFFKAIDRLIVTGPTRTNVNDFRAVLIQSPD